MATNKSSSMESLDGIGTPLTSPSETRSPVHTESAKSASEKLVVFQSDPSLPALLSGASSVSADMESELTGRPGRLGRQPSRPEESSEAVTPPALLKEPSVSPIFNHTPAMESDSLRLHLEHDRAQSDVDMDSSTPHLDEDDESDDGIFLMAKPKKKKKKSSPTTAASRTRPFGNKRRDTGASTASNETAKKVL